jgi:hypothetical protein
MGDIPINLDLIDKIKLKLNTKLCLLELAIATAKSLFLTFDL